METPMIRRPWPLHNEATKQVLEEHIKVHGNIALYSTVLVLTAGLTNGCAAWRYVPNERAATTIQETNPRRARFALGDSMVYVSNPSIVRDSLVGTVPRGDVKQKASFALSSVDSLSVPSIRNERWIAAGIFVAFITAALISTPTPQGIP
jgi:hypothetical protein